MTERRIGFWCGVGSCAAVGLIIWLGTSGHADHPLKTSQSIIFVIGFVAVWLGGVFACVEGLSDPPSPDKANQEKDAE